MELAWGRSGSDNESTSEKCRGEYPSQGSPPLGSVIAVCGQERPRLQSHQAGDVRSKEPSPSGGLRPRPLASPAYASAR